MQTLAALNARYRNPQGVALVYLLGWIAGCDGKIDDQEKSFLTEFAAALLNDKGAATSFLPVIKKAATKDVIAACRHLKKTVDRKNAQPLFEVTLAMAMADGVFSVGENHIIRFFADLLGLTNVQFTASFQNVTGRNPQPPSDLSKASWWIERDRQREAREARESASRQQEQRRQTSESRAKASSSTGQSRSDSPRPSGNSRRSEALKHLGLEGGASQEEIRAAYKRLAKIHHPDRFEGLSVEIIEAANLSFRRIREAYELLT